MDLTSDGVRVALEALVSVGAGSVPLFPIGGVAMMLSPLAMPRLLMAEESRLRRAGLTWRVIQDDDGGLRPAWVLNRQPLPPMIEWPPRDGSHVIRCGAEQ